MRGLLLIAAAAVVLAFGWYLMGKLDAFLARNRREQEGLCSADADSLRIGFADPLMADSLSRVIDRYSAIHPEVSVSVLDGKAAELIRALYANDLDLIFLPENAFVPQKMRGHVDTVSLQYIPVKMQYGGLPIEPITEGCVQQKIIWSEDGIHPELDRLIRYLKDGYLQTEQNSSHREVV